MVPGPKPLPEEMELIVRLMQVCNVGDICGGTAACAWSIAHAFPEWEHVVFFLSKPTAETRLAFEGCELRQGRTLKDQDVRDAKADLVLLHNTSSQKTEKIRSAFTLQYCHSAGDHAAADATVACSNWLSRKMREQPDVLHQPVLIPPRPADLSFRHLDEELTVGRICTPRMRKWPLEALPLYRSVTLAFPELHWEFVGCPSEVQPQWSQACENRVRFLPAGWQSRSHLWNWHAMLYHHPDLTESFGRTVAEALRAGCLPIVDQRGGFFEQLEDSPAGFLCGSPEEFISAVTRIREPAARWQLSKEGQNFSEQRWSLAAFRERFIDLLNNLTGSDHGTEASG